MDARPAPAELEHVRRFVNTLRLNPDEEDLATPAALANWLTERGLLARGETVTGPELRQAHEVRDALRKLMLANNGEALDPAAVETINAAARTAELAVRVDTDGNGSLAPVRSGFDGALAHLLAIVVRSMTDGTWTRMKACGRSTCHWAFYDASRNRSATWCDMGTCGNREKARAYRERHRGH